MTQPSNVRLVTEATLPNLATPKISVAATVTSSATLAANKDTPVDATAGPLTMTLPTNAAAGAMLAVEKVDASANAVTVSGTLRGVAASVIALTSQYEARVFLSEGSGSWRPLADHRTSASLTATFVGLGQRPADAPAFGWFFPEAHGATGDGAADDTAALQAAINAAALSSDRYGDARVMLKAGGKYVASQLTMKSGVAVDGQIRSTQITQKAGTSGDLFILATPDTQAVALRNLTINGNKTNQTATNRGVYFDNTGFTFSGTANHVIENVYVRACKGDGIYMGFGSRGSQLSRVQCYGNDGYGMVLAGSDSQVAVYDIGKSGKSGLYVVGDNITIGDGKCWYSGDVVGGSDGHGIWVQGNRNRLGNVQSQENKGHGLQIFKSGGNAQANSIVGFTSDGDNRAIIDSAGSTFSGVNIAGSASDNYVRGTVTNATGLAGKTYNGVACSTTGARNDIEVIVEGTASTEVAGSGLANNTVAVGGRAGRILTVTYVSNPTPGSSLWRAETQQITLAGNQAWTSTSAPAGLLLRLVLIQDATGGRVATFGSGFTMGTWAQNLAPNAQSLIEFVGDGTNWVQRADSAVKNLNWSATDHGLVGWTCDPSAMSATGSPTLGTAYVARVKVTRGATVSNALLQIATAGATLANCYVGVYDTTGTRLGVSADQSASWQSTGLKTVALTASTVVNDDWLDIVVLCNGTTAPALARGANNTFINAGLSVPRYANANSGITALPATLGAKAAASQAFWLAVS